MAKDRNQAQTSEEIYAAPVPNVAQLTTGINQIIAGEVNSYAVRNEIILAKKQEEICKMNGKVLPMTAKSLQMQAKRKIAAFANEQQEDLRQEQKKRQILYRKGFTVAHATFEILDAESKLDIDHSAKLGRNAVIAYPNPIRASETDAHHIVAREDWRADLSRIYIFKVGVGINDADNACIMPRYVTTLISAMPNASKHQEIHTAKYHANVYAELTYAAEHTKAEVRLTLCYIKSQLIAGTFSF